MPYTSGGTTRSNGFTNALAKQAAAEQKAVKAKKKSSGGGGFLGTGIGPDVNLGIDEVGREIGGFIPSLVETLAWRPTQAAFHTVTGDFGGAKHDLSMEARAGKGIASSLTGTGADALDAIPVVNPIARAVTGESAGDLYRDAVGKVLGGEPGHPNAYKPKPFLQRVQERGLISPIVETVGNVAMGADLGGAAVGGVGRAAGAAGAEDTAARLADAATTMRESAAAHPLRGLYTDNIRPYTQAAFDHQMGATNDVGSLTAQAPPASFPGDRQAFLDEVERVHGPDIRSKVESDLAVQETPEPTQKLQGIADLEHRDIDPRIQQAVSRLNPEGRPAKVLSWLERQSQAREVRTAAGQLRHLTDAGRNELFHDPAVQTSVDAARKLIEDAGVKPEDASQMIGDEIAARTSGVSQVFADSAPEVQGALRDVGARTTTIPDAARSPELDSLIDTAVGHFKRLAGERLATLKESRPGDRGLETMDATAPTMTRSEQTLLKLSDAARAKAAELRGRVPAEDQAMQARIAAAEEHAQVLGQQVSDYQGIRNQAAEGLVDRQAAPGVPEPPVPTEASSARQQAARASVGPQETPAEALRRGRNLGYDVRKIEDANRRIAAKIDAKRTADAAVADMKATLAAGELPSAQRAALLDARSERTLLKLGESLDHAPYSRWPARWQPLGQAVQSLAKEAETRPELAAYLEEIPKTFTEVIQRAQELGLDPEHVRNFRPSQVRQLIYDTVRLGKSGRDMGQEVLSGTRKTRRFVATGVDRSIESLAAATQEATHELRTNQLVDLVENHLAVPVEQGGVIPEGMVPWDPVRQFLLTGTDDGQVVAGQGVRYMVPKQVKTTLYRMTQDYNNGLFAAISKVTNPWRAFVLTLSPRWYANNFLGNLGMATAEGVKLRDWSQAWESFKKDKGQDGRFADVPAIRGHSMVSDIGDPTIIPNRTGIQGMKDAWERGEGKLEKVGNIRRQIGHTLRRANEAVDEFARAAVYHKTMRTTGSSELALERANKALIDYGDLSPFEQQAVRAVVPFYAWQKGILKLVVKFPVDHPVASALVLQLGQMHEQVLKDRFGGDVPVGYAGLLDVGGGGALNTRGANPFQDSLSLSTRDGILGSLNPFLEAGARTIFNAPDQGYADSYRMNSYGLAVPDVKPSAQLGDIIKGLPAAQLEGAYAGGGTYGPGQQTARFLGIPYMTKSDVGRAIDRTRKARVKMGTEKAAPSKSAKAFSPFRPLGG